jgi:class 3 adenylate cyclase/YHS domain-containing protein
VDAELTLEQLSERTGEPVEHLRRWRELGLIGVAGAKGFEAEDVARVGLTQLGLRRAVPLEAIARAFEEGLLSWHCAELTTRGRKYTLADVSEVLGIDQGLLRRFLQAANLGDWPEPLASEEDLETLRSLKVALDAGFPEDPLIQLVRVLAEGLGKVAEAETRMFRFYVMRRLQEQGLVGQDLLRAIEAINEQTVPLMEPTILFFHRKAREAAARDDAAVVMAEAAGLHKDRGVPGEMTAAIVFIDLSSFTPLTEAMGDLKAAAVLERFSTLVRDCAGRWDGRVVKQIGDAFMLVFPDARAAVACALELEERTAEEPQFPAARSGVHWGPVLYREADYVGTNVNIASRVAAEAERHQVLVTSAVRMEAKGLDGVEFARLGKRRLKGLSGELVLFEARAAGAAAKEQHVDPVCGMEMAADEVAARLTLEGVERCFCSDECLRLYVAAPEKYGG